MVDLYDDISGPVETTTSTSTAGTPIGGTDESPVRCVASSENNNGNSGANGVYSQTAGGINAGALARRFQLYIGNLTWVNLI